MAGSTLEGPALSLTSDVFDHLTWGEVKIERKIGQGAYGDVFKARYFGYPVAVKVIKDPLSADEVKREKILEELKIMVLLKHPNVVMLMGACLTPDNQVAIITEMCERGNLKDCIKDIKSLPIRLKLAKDIACGLNWLHSNHIIHRDLKLANLLVSWDWTVKITDFGLSLHWHPGIVCHHFKGNVKYSAPEILRARSDKNITVYSYGPQTDVYSFGLMLWELVTCMPLFPGVKGKQNITDHVLFGNRPEIYEEWPKSLKTLLQLSWHVDPVRRPLFSEIQEKFDRVIIDVMCLAKDTPILMADGSFKMVQDIVEGDQVMGEDGVEVRTVQATTSGRQTMARVTLRSLRPGQTEPESFECNLSHLLSLKVAHAARLGTTEEGVASVSVVACRRGGVAQLGDKVVDRLWTMSREVASLREAATIVVALGGHVQQAREVFSSLGDAIRAVSAHCKLDLDEAEVGAIADRTVAGASTAFAVEEEAATKVRRCPAAADVHAATAAVNRAWPTSPVRLAFDDRQVAAMKRALAVSLALPEGTEPYAHDETVDVATRHILDPVAVDKTVRRNLLAYHAPVLTFAAATEVEVAPSLSPYDLGYLVAAATTGDEATATTAAARHLELPRDAVASVAAEPRVPNSYRVGSVDDRRQLLAGLLDGALAQTEAVGVTRIDEVEGAVLPVTPGSPLAEDATFVARSLGLTAWQSARGVHVCAGPGDVPTRGGQKWAERGRVSGRAAIDLTVLGDGDFYGFTLDGNGRFFVGHSLIATHNCPDPTGRRICKKLWRGEELRRVPYDEFEETFLEKTRLNLKLIRHVHLKALCAVICDPYDDTVTLERFCNCVNWFGPMYPVEKFLDRLKDELSNDWFHGYVSSNRAAQLLKTRWSSTKMTYYLCRFSLSAPGCFAFTFVDEDGQIVHKRVSHSYNTNYCLTNSSPALEAPTLDQLHALARQQNDLLRGKRVLPGNPHQSLFL
jgi:serine/threonine protein kinase